MRNLLCLFFNLIFTLGYSQEKNIRSEITISNQNSASYNMTTDWIRKFPIFLQPGAGVNFVKAFNKNTFLVFGIDYRLNRPAISFRAPLYHPDLRDRLPAQNGNFTDIAFLSWSFGSFELPLNLRYRFKGSHFLEFGIALNYYLLRELSANMFYSNLDLPNNDNQKVLSTTNQYNFRPNSEIGVVLNAKYRYEIKNPKLNRFFITLSARYQLYNNPTVLIEYLNFEDEFLHLEHAEIGRFGSAIGLGIKLGDIVTK